MSEDPLVQLLADVREVRRAIRKALFYADTGNPVVMEGADKEMARLGVLWQEIEDLDFDLTKRAEGGGDE